MYFLKLSAGLNSQIDLPPTLLDINSRHVYLLKKFDSIVVATSKNVMTP